MNRSLSSQSLITERYFCDQLIQNTRKVKVYIRTVPRKAFKIQLPAEIQLSELKQIIQKRFQIIKQKQLLYLKGICLNFNAEIMLQNNWIIHVINLSECNLPEIIIQIKTTSLIAQQIGFLKCSINPKMSLKKFVQEFIVNQFSVNLQQILFVESGRILKLNLSFQEQNISNKTTINLIHIKKDQKTHSNFNIHFEQTTQKINQNRKEQSQIKQIKSQCNLSIHQKTNGSVKQNKFTIKQKNCQLHNKKQKQFRYSSQNIDASTQDFSVSLRSSDYSIITSNKSIEIGRRECNCKHQVKPKQPKFISKQDKKKLQKQIREQNLHKLMLRKQRIQQNKSPQQGQRTERNELTKVKSLDYFKNNRTQRKPTQILPNPQKIIKT